MSEQDNEPAMDLNGDIVKVSNTDFVIRRDDTLNITFVLCSSLTTLKQNLVNIQAFTVKTASDEADTNSTTAKSQEVVEDIRPRRQPTENIDQTMGNIGITENGVKVPTENTDRSMLLTDQDQ
uniref:Uncharacterized protein n=1 Tax=Clytia hemisphaerica TaxID=252671 RepID=A0A7M5WQE8_9CNID